MEIPESPQAMTPSWLTKALRGRGTLDPIVVQSFSVQRIGEKEGFAGFVYRIGLDYTQSGTDAPRSLIAKFAPVEPELRIALRPGNEREVRFYKDIAAEGPFPVARCYYGDIDAESGACILLLEDLSHLRSIDFIDGCTIADAELVLRGMAGFHATWWNNPRLQAMPWLLSLADSAYLDWWAEYPQRAAALLPDYPLPESLLAIGQRFAADMPGVLERLESGPVACIHRDIHVDNLLFGAPDRSPAFRMVDWQTVGKGRAVSDVGYFLMSSLPTDQRRQAETRLLHMYHDLLVEHGVRDYSFEDCWFDYRFSAIAKLFITVQMTVLVDNSVDHRLQWRRTDLDRLTAFIHDHRVDELV